MPTPRPKHRTYCKTCNNFTIHSADYICETCQTEFTSYFPSEVDKDLVEKQRQRYRQQKLDNFRDLTDVYLNPPNILNQLFNPPQSIGIKVIECDAGQVEIDNKKKQIREQEKQRIQNIQDDYNTNYKHLNRNDKCACGSGKKFKHCHLIEFKKDIKLWKVG